MAPLPGIKPRSLSTKADMLPSHHPTPLRQWSPFGWQQKHPYLRKRPNLPRISTLFVHRNRAARCAKMLPLGLLCLHPLIRFRFPPYVCNLTTLSPNFRSLALGNVLKCSPRGRDPQNTENRCSSITNSGVKKRLHIDARKDFHQSALQKRPSTFHVRAISCTIPHPAQVS
jgi:hypothetical protein